MIGWPANTRIWIAAGVTDLRRGFTGLSALVETKVEQKPSPGTSSCFAGDVAISSRFCGMTAMVCAISLQKTHRIAFESRQVCYPCHRWYGRSVLTRRAGGAHADVAFLCKLPEAPIDGQTCGYNH